MTTQPRTAAKMLRTTALGAGLEPDLHRRLHEPGPLVTITKAQAAWLLDRIARLEAAAPALDVERKPGWYSRSTVPNPSVTATPTRSIPTTNSASGPFSKTSLSTPHRLSHD